MMSGMTVDPGLIDSETNLGLAENEAEKMTNDLVEMSDETMPQTHVTDAFHAESELNPVTRYNGILNATLRLRPGDFAGTGCVHPACRSLSVRDADRPRDRYAA